MHQVQLLSSSPSDLTAFLVLWQGSSIYVFFRFLLFPLSGLLGRKNLLYGKFSVFFFYFWGFFLILYFQLSLGLVFSPGLGNPFVSQNPCVFYASHSPIGLCLYHLLVMVKFQSLVQFPGDHLLLSSRVKSPTPFSLVFFIRLLYD